jgi:sugar lactone lactonase YvrE
MTPLPFLTNLLIDIFGLDRGIIKEKYSFRGKFGKPGKLGKELNGQFSPWSLRSAAFDGFGNLYVGNQHGIQIFSSDYRFIRRIEDPKNQDFIQYPRCLTFDEFGNLFVVDSSNQNNGPYADERKTRVRKMKPDTGKVLVHFDEEHPQDCTGIVVAVSSRPLGFGGATIFMTNQQKHKIQTLEDVRWGPEIGTPAAADPKPGDPDFRAGGGDGSSSAAGIGSICDPQALAIDFQTGNLFVAEPNRIAVFSSSGEFIRAIAEKSVSGPRGIDVDRNGNVIIANTGGNTIEIYSSEGKFLTRISNSGSRQMTQPTNALIASNGDIWVLDSYNHRILVFG